MRPKRPRDADAGDDHNATTYGCTHLNVLALDGMQRGLGSPRSSKSIATKGAPGIPEVVACGGNRARTISCLQRCLLVASFGIGCGSSTPDCALLGERYATAFHEALLCDPATVSPCANARPVVVYEINGSTQVFQGIATNCDHALRSGALTAVDEALADYRAAGCHAAPVPICQGLMNECSGVAGSATCLP